MEMHTEKIIWNVNASLLFGTEVFFTSVVFSWSVLHPPTQAPPPPLRSESFPNQKLIDSHVMQGVSVLY